MNRIEYMSELASLLQNVPEEERRDAMKYYNDYFDEAGEENEEEVIKELGSPAKVAESIKADMKANEEDLQSHGEFSETGYSDERFESREIPGYRYGEQSGQNGAYQQAASQQEPPRTSKALKIVLIIAIILVASPVVIPVALAIGAVILALICAAFAVVIGLVAAAVAIAIAGIAVFIVGLLTLVPRIAVGMALIGTGLILTVLGVVGTVAMIKLCFVAIPGIVHGITWVFEKLFHRRAVA